MRIRIAALLALTTAREPSSAPARLANIAVNGGVSECAWRQWR